MSPYRVIGIDPALTATGLCVLESSKPGDYRVTDSKTIRTYSNSPMLVRLNAIRQGVHDYVQTQRVQAVIMEDPTRQHATSTKRQNPRSIAVMSLAIGVALGAVLELHPTVEFIDVEDWMPRLPMKRGSLTYAMPRDQMSRYLLSRIQVPEGASEHVLMSAGVARYWIEQERHAERLRAAG